MDFATAPELDEIRSAVRTLCARFPGEYWRALEPDRYPEEFVRALTEARLARRADPRGVRRRRPRPDRSERDPRGDQRSGGNAAACHAQMYIMGTLLRHGSEEQKRRYLPQIAGGELRLQAFGVTEPNAGSDTTRIETTAERVDGGYSDPRPEDLDVARAPLRPDAAARADDADRGGRAADATGSRSSSSTCARRRARRSTIRPIDDDDEPRARPRSSSTSSKSRPRRADRRGGARASATSSTA